MISSNINQLLFVMKMRCFFFEVGTEFLKYYDYYAFFALCAQSDRMLH
jgi:hypothetical protein